MDLKDPKNYFNRDLSWLEFNRRVLNEALDTTLPLLERIKFLSIFCSNLDEFYMIRVSGLMEQIDLGLSEKSVDGMTPQETIKAIEAKIRPMLNTLIECFQNDILPKLSNEGIFFVKYDELNETEKECLNLYFDREIFPVLTPLAFDPGRPFPHISNLSTNLAVVIEPEEENEKHFARVKLPHTLSRIVNVNKLLQKSGKTNALNGKVKIIFLEQIVKSNIKKLFPKINITGVYTFRVTRDTDLEIQEDEADDLLKTIEENIKQRKFGSVVRLEIEEDIPVEIKNILVKNLEIDENSVHIINGPVGLKDLWAIHDLPFPKLKTRPFTPAIPKIFENENNIFSLIRKNDILLHHPYHSFTPVVDFIKQASVDPNVLAIKQTLYRVGPNSPIIESLIEAAENGKQVAVLVELKARFDEENNILWARRLEKVGIHVVYGLIGLKTHCKIAMVIRKETSGLVRYIHLGTGNYNVITSKIYTDFGLLTSDESLSSDATELFNYLTGYSKQDNFKELLVAPINLRKKILKLIENEINNHKQNGNGKIIIKVNAITDSEIIRSLYKASIAGVKIDLLVRGTCMLRPGVKGLSENINVISIVGRFLEHSRIFFFENNGNKILYLGSADLMERNLNRRVETLFPIKNKILKNYILKGILNIQLNDNFNAWELKSDGQYLAKIHGDNSVIDSHSALLINAKKDICWASNSL